MNRKGQALVEFVLILPVFILILFAIIDFGTILSEKNELENNSLDITLLVNNKMNIEEIKNQYKDIDIEVIEEEKYTKLLLKKKINIITPGLNLILSDPYEVIVERITPNETE